MKRANEELEEANRYSVALKGDAKKLFDLSWKAGSKSKAYGDKEWDAAVDDTAKKYRNDNHIRISDKDIAAVKKAIQYNEFDPSTNEDLDLSATGDTTTSSASQEVEQVEDLKEYTGMSISKSVNSNDVATALKNLKKGTKLYVQGKPRGGQRTMGDVVSVSGDTVKIKPTASNGPTSVNVKDITMMDTLKEELDEATFSTSQIDALKKAYGPVGPGGEKNAMQMDKLKKLMSRYPKTMLNTLAKSDIPMVSKVAKELMKEETLVEQWKFEMDIETNDDGDMILVHGNVSASSESQAQQKFDKLEKEMEKKYGQGSVEGGVFKGKNTHTSGRGPVTRKNI